MSLSEILWRDDPFLQDPNTYNILTIIMPVFLCENILEKSWTKANKIDLEFLGLVTRIDLLCRIPRCVPKG
jgi:hypothetical protein